MQRGLQRGFIAKHFIFARENGGNVKTTGTYPHSGYIGPAATKWVPMGRQVSALSENDHPIPSNGQQKCFIKSQSLNPTQ